MNKKILIIIIAVAVLLILVIPIPTGVYDDGGTRTYTALTYKIVKWRRLCAVNGEYGAYEKTRVYFFADRNKSIDELWEREIQKIVPSNVDAKPVIYLYPEETTDVSVKLTLDGDITCTYPAYNDGWRVTAAPDGTLSDANGRTYNYLYWEGMTYAKYDFSKGFCVKGEDTAAFLEEMLAKAGLTRREANEFIVYWLPLMQDNPYNIISFQTDIYTEAAKLSISPSPDTLIRVFMAWHAADSYVELEEQILSAPKRNGFTVVEWGGAEIKNK